MKVELGENFIFELLKGDLKDTPIQEAVTKKVFVAILSELEQLKKDQEEAVLQKSIRDMMDFDK